LAPSWARSLTCLTPFADRLERTVLLVDVLLDCVDAGNRPSLHGHASESP
jgi:hypothetical protein